MEINPQNIHAPMWAWAIFIGIVLAILGLDLLIASKESKKVKLKSALLWSAVWISLAGFFAVGLMLWEQAGAPAASKFAAGYILELSLSVDNLFVFILIFTHYKVPEIYHRKVLFWGILGALALRAIFIAAGAALVSNFSWILYIFGAFLVYTGVNLIRHKESDVKPEKSPIIALAHKFFRVTTKYEGDRFVIWRKGVMWVTPLLIIVLVVEVTDLIFAVDSIPAVFGVTTDPFIVYTSNIFAILGLRSMFFALEGVMHMFRFLKMGLAFILTLIGLKLLILPWLETRFAFHAGEYATLAVIFLILGVSIATSVLIPKRPPLTPKKKGKR